MKHILYPLDLFLFSIREYFVHYAKEDSKMARFSTSLVLLLCFCNIIFILMNYFNVALKRVDFSSRGLYYLYIILIMFLLFIPCYMIVWKREKHYLDDRFIFSRFNIFYVVLILLINFAIFVCFVVYTHGW